MAFVILHGQKVMRYVQLTRQETISQKATYTCNKMLCLILDYVKNCPSGVLFVALGSFSWSDLVHEFTKFERVCINAPISKQISSCREECFEGFSFQVPCLKL